MSATHRRPLREDARVDGVEYRRLDVLTDELDALVDYETAIWCIGRSDHRAAWTDPSGELTANSVLLARFLEQFRGKLVLVSSGAVYHGLRGPVTPTTPLTPLHPYAVSKLAAERLALAHAASGRLSDLVVLRLFHPFGPGERPTRLMPQFLTRFVTEGEPRFTRARRWPDADGRPARRVRRRCDRRRREPSRPTGSWWTSAGEAASGSSTSSTRSAARSGSTRDRDASVARPKSHRVRPRSGSRPGALGAPGRRRPRACGSAYAEQFDPELFAQAIATTKAVRSAPTVLRARVAGRARR